MITKIKNREKAFKQKYILEKKKNMQKFKGIVLDRRKARFFSLETFPFCQCSCCKDTVQSGYHFKESPKGPINLCKGCYTYLTKNPERKVKLIYNNPETNRRRF